MPGVFEDALGFGIRPEDGEDAALLCGVGVVGGVEFADCGEEDTACFAVADAEGAGGVLVSVGWER